MLAPWKLGLSRRIVVFGLSRFPQSDRLVLYFSVSETTPLSFRCPLFATTAIDQSSVCMFGK